MPPHTPAHAVGRHRPPAGEVPVFVDPTRRRPRRAALVVASGLAGFLGFVGVVSGAAAQADAAPWRPQPAATITPVATR